MGLNGRKPDNEIRERSQAKTGLNPASRRQHVPTGSAGTESPPDDQMTSILVPALPKPVESPSLWQPKLFPHISQRPQEHDWGPAETDKLIFFQAGGRQIHYVLQETSSGDQNEDREMGGRKCSSGGGGRSRRQEPRPALGPGGQSVGMAQREGFRNFPDSSSGMAG